MIRGLIILFLPVLPVGDVLKLAGVAPAADGTVVGVEAEQLRGEIAVIYFLEGGEYHRYAEPFGDLMQHL